MKANSIKARWAVPQHLDLGDMTDIPPQKLEELVLRRYTLEDLIQEIPCITAECRREKNYEVAAKPCIVTRLLWAYYDAAYGPWAKPPSPVLQARILRGLAACRKALEFCLKSMKDGGANVQEIRDVEDYLKNVIFREKCIELTGKGKAQEARREIDKRIKKKERARYEKRAEALAA